MAKFNIGDHVRVITKRHHESQFDCTGYVTDIDHASLLARELPIAVTLADGRELLYSDDDLELIIGLCLSDPEFDLDEIHAGEELVNQRG